MAGNHPNDAVDSVVSPQPLKERDIQSGKRPKTAPTVIQSYDDFYDFYEFNHPYRGNAIIINNEKFKTMAERKGTQNDGKVLKKCLESLDFIVTLKENQKADDIKKLLEDEARSDHSSEDCFLLTIMTHGNQDSIFGVDEKPVLIEDITKPFKGKNSLLNKPKIFIFQACRGTKLVDSVEADGEGQVESDGIGEPPQCRIPVEADFLYAYSTLLDHYSWRNKVGGSWYIQELAKLLTIFGTQKSFTDILTKLNRSVIKGYETKTATSEHTNKRQQMGMFTSTLTKNIIFKPK